MEKLLQVEHRKVPFHEGNDLKCCLITTLLCDLENKKGHVLNKNLVFETVSKYSKNYYFFI